MSTAALASRTRHLAELHRAAEAADARVSSYVIALLPELRALAPDSAAVRVLIEAAEEAQQARAEWHAA